MIIITTVRSGFFFVFASFFSFSDDFLCFPNKSSAVYVQNNINVRLRKVRVSQTDRSIMYHKTHNYIPSTSQSRMSFFFYYYHYCFVVIVIVGGLCVRQRPSRWLRTACAYRRYYYHYCNSINAIADRFIKRNLR